MNNEQFILVCEEYEGIYKYAINRIACELSKKLNYVLPVVRLRDISKKDFIENNLILIGKVSHNNIYEALVKENLITVPQKEQSYSIYVGESPFNNDLQTVAIFGRDENGVLYGAMDFINRYLGCEIYNGRKRNMMEKGYFDEVLDDKLPEWKISETPAIKHRALWTWGHVVYDYKKYLENMATLRLNEIVIWNDVAPINAKDVVEYAHSLGIKVIWGFAWGWGVNCKKHVESFSEESLLELKESIVNKYKNEYSDTNADGIYFQSFTELHVDNVNGKCIAEIVTKLVNEVGDAMLKEYPELHIQFGLHATSVKNKLEFIKNVDKRIHIVWEDCGAFPYNYLVNKVDDFKQTIDFTKELLTLRGQDEKFGAVLKGMVNLDWVKFKHYEKSFVMGENFNSLSLDKIKDRERIWKYIQADWLKNAGCFKDLIEVIAKKSDNVIIEGLVEDALFESFISLPTAIFAEILWNPNQNINELMTEISKFSCVKFANL